MLVIYSHSLDISPKFINIIGWEKGRKVFYHEY